MGPEDYQNVNGVSSGVTNFMGGNGGTPQPAAAGGNAGGGFGSWLGSNSMSQGMGIGGNMNNMDMLMMSDQMGGQLFGMIAGQNESTAGNIMKSIPGLSTIGNIFNAALGSHINKEFVNQVNHNARALRSRKFNSNTNADVLNDWKSSFQLANVTKDEVGSDGWFSSKASDKTNELNDTINNANRIQLMNLGIAAGNADQNSDLRIMKNMAAYGGPINSFRKYYGEGGYISQAKALIRQNEGWREKPYKDAPKGKNWRSVGYGFNDSGFREKYPEGISKHYEHGITKKQAEEELDYFLNKAEKQLKSIYGKQWNDFTDSQKAAILDTYYQRPASVGKSSRFYKAVTAGEDAGKYLGVAGYNKRNKIRQGVFGGGYSDYGDWTMTESPEPNSSSLQEVTSIPVVQGLDLEGVTPTQARALELNLASPAYPFGSFAQSVAPQQAIPTVGTVEDFLASYDDFEDNLYGGGGWLDFFSAWNQSRGGNNLFANNEWKPSDGLQKNTSNGSAQDWLGVASSVTNTLGNWGKEDPSLGRGGGYSMFGMAAYDLMKMIGDATKDKRESIDQKLGIPIYANGGHLFNDGGSVGAMGYAQIGTSALKLASNAVAQSRLDVDSDKVNRSIRRFGSTLDDTIGDVNTNGDLLDLWNNASWMQGDLEAMDFRNKSLFDDFLNSYAASWEGFNAGQNFGPWGAAIGAIVGGGSSVIGSIIGRNKADNAADEANERIEEANNRITKNLLAAAERVDEQNDFRILQSMKADGGKLNMGFGLKNPFIVPDGTANPLYKAFGGGLTHGAVWDTGINWVDEGGSHGENPLGGVPMGIDEQGVPNLVEEGEAIWNGDYVFSKRMKVPKKLAKKYGLGGDMTFADAVAKLTKASEERPLSRIDQDTNDAVLGEFADTQEDMRMAKAQRAMEKQQQLQDDFMTGFQFGLGGHISPLGLVPDANNISLLEVIGSQFKDGGGIHIKEKNKGKFTEQAKDAGMGVQEFASHVLANKDDYSSSTVKRANFAHIFGGRNYAYGGPFGNVFEGTGNKPNSLNLNASEQSLARRLFGDSGFTRFMENASTAMNDPIGYFAGNEIENIMNKIATMSEPQMEAFFNTNVGQAVAKAITTIDNMPTSSAKEAGVQRWLKSTGRLAKPVYKATVNAAKRSLTQSKLNARGQMKTPKGGGKPTTLNETMSQIKAAQNNLPVVRKNQALATQGPRNVATTSTGASGVAATGKGITDVGFPTQQRWDATMPFWGGLGIAAGNIANWEKEPEVDAITGAANVQRPADNQGGAVGTGTNKSNRFINGQPATSNKKKGKGITPVQTDDFVEDNREVASTIAEDPENAFNFGDPEVTRNVEAGLNPDGSKPLQEVGPNVTPTARNKFKPKQTWTRNVPWLMSGIMGMKEMLTPADYSNADAITAAAYQAGQPVSIGTEYIGDYRKRDPFDERYLMNIINQNAAATNRNIMNLSGGNSALAMSGLFTNDLIKSSALADAARQAYLANRADDADVAQFNKDTNKFNAQAQNTRNLTLAQLNSGRQNALLSGIAQGARLRQAIKDQRDAAISANFTNFAQSLGDMGKENGYYNMLGGLNEEGILKYFYGDNWKTVWNAGHPGEETI